MASKGRQLLDRGLAVLQGVKEESAVIRRRLAKRTGRAGADHTSGGMSFARQLFVLGEDLDGALRGQRAPQQVRVDASSVGHVEHPTRNGPERLQAEPQ